MSNQIITVAQLVNTLKKKIDSDSSTKNILVKGEISNFTNHRSGHYYFSLKDTQSKISCVMFQSNTRNVKFKIEEGMQVIVTATLSMYAATTNVQLYVVNMEPDGLGKLYLEYEQLKNKLLNEGLFNKENKKDIPLYPMSIGIISAATGAAIHDTLNIIKRRWPIVDIKFYPSLVQGESASIDIINTLNKADNNNHDLILLVRGGGAIEDLWCFNDESLVRTIYNMNTCIICGVGHESDITLVDYVCDKRAPTPSGAAELATPDIEEVISKLNNYSRFLNTNIKDKLNTCKNNLNNIRNNKIFTNPKEISQNYKFQLMMFENQMDNFNYKIQDYNNIINSNSNKLNYLISNIINNNTNKINNYMNRLGNSYNINLNNNKKELSNIISLLKAYNPLNTLDRGFTLAYKEDKLIKDYEDININDTLNIKFKDGIVITKVIDKE